MAVRAVLRGGMAVTLRADLGATPAAVVEGLSAQTLLGSGAPPADMWLEAADGTMIRYADVARLETTREGET